MTATDQEALFKQVQSKFAGMSNRWHSGYVAGAQDSDKGESPSVDSDTDYDDGYKAGYLDAEGLEALALYPVFFVGTGADDLEYQWWKQK